MYKAKITNIEKVRHQADAKDYLEVTVDIIAIETKDVVHTHKQWLSPAISKEELLAEVEKMRAGWELEQIQKEENYEENKINENVNELQADLIGFEVEAPEDIEEIKEK